MTRSLAAWAPAGTSPPSPRCQARRTGHLRTLCAGRGTQPALPVGRGGDRLGIIDDTGAYLTPNQVLVLLYDYLLARKGWTGPTVRNTSATHLLDRVAAAHGQVCYKVPVGFKRISAKMAETGAVIGGEFSGGPDRARSHPRQGRDPCQLPAGRGGGSLRQAALRALRRIVARYGELVMVESAYGFTSERHAKLEERIFSARDLPAFTQDVERVSWADSCKVYFTGGWVTIRFSGTEPLLRVFAEMPTDDEARATADAVASHDGLDA